MTERDKKLLTILLAVVIVVLFFNYMIIPMKTEGDALDTEIESAKLEQVAMQTKIASLPALEQNFTSLQTSYLEAATDYYPIMTSQEIDREITGLVLGCGLDSENLNISMPADPSTLEAFYASLAALTAQLGMTGADSTAAGSDTAADTSAVDSAAAEDTSAADTAQGSGNQNTEVYAAAVTVTAEGTESAFQTLIDKVTNDYPAIRVSGYSYQTKQGTVSYDADGNLVSQAAGRILTLNLEFYMCSKTF